MLTIPPYIERTAPGLAPVTYEWDDDDPEDAYLGHNERLRNRITDTSEKGVVALALGFAEWVAWRLYPHTENHSLLNYIEAVWAGLIDWHYIQSFDFPDPDDWQGPVLGPMWAAFDLIDDITSLVSTNQFASPECVNLSNLALYVVPNPEPVKSWRKAAIERLAKAHPRLPADPVGAPVPRQALDPDYAYSSEQDSALLQQFLSNLDYNKNPFLASPEQLKHAGFHGVPYRYPTQ